MIELDGRKRGPMVYRECEHSNFMLNVFDICLEHYVSQDENEVGFNLMIA